MVKQSYISEFLKRFFSSFRKTHKKWLITFHFSKNTLSFSEYSSFSKGAFVLKMWKLCERFHEVFFIFPKNTFVNKVCKQKSVVTWKSFSDEVGLKPTKYIKSFRICFSCQEFIIHYNYLKGLTCNLNFRHKLLQFLQWEGLGQNLQLQ